MILLDTHAWVWFINDPSQLSSKARQAVTAAARAGEVLISSISVWELSLLVQRARLTLSIELTDWLAQCERLSFLKFVPVDNSIAYQSVYLPFPLHGDPADRIIAATALVTRAALVTRDQRLRAHSALRTIW